MWINVPSLQEALENAELGEFRQRQGKRYALQPVLLLSCVALMCGAQSEQEIAKWCSTDYGKRWIKWLGIKTQRSPSTATIIRIFRGVDCGRLEAGVILWTQQILESLQHSTDEGWDELAAELENSEFIINGDVEGSYLLVDLSHRLKILLECLIGFSERDDFGARRESLITGLILTGYIETSDLRKSQKDRRSLPESSDEIRHGFLPWILSRVRIERVVS